MLYEYLAGLVFGDGCFYYDRHARMYYVYVYDGSKEFLERIAKLMERETGIRNIRLRRLRGRNSYELRIAGKKLFHELQELIRHNKLKPSIDFIRGLVDAEGTLYIDKYNGVTTEIANTDRIVLENTRKELFKHGIKSFVIIENRKPPRKKLYKIRIRGLDRVSYFLRTINPLHPRFKRRRLPSP